MNATYIGEKLIGVLHNITGLTNPKFGSLVHYEDWGQLELTLGVPHFYHLNNAFNVALNGSIRIRLVENYWDDMAHLLIDNYKDNFDISRYKIVDYQKLDGIATYVFGPPHFMPSSDLLSQTDDRGNPTYENTPEDYLALEKEFTWLYHDYFLPKLKETLDLRFLDSTINSKVEIEDGDSSKFFLNMTEIMFRRMILAKLVNNPLYEDICFYSKNKLYDIVNMAETYSIPLLKNYPKVFEEVYKRIKNVEPLKETKLVLNLS